MYIFSCTLKGHYYFSIQTLKDWQKLELERIVFTIRSNAALLSSFICDKTLNIVKIDELSTDSVDESVY